VRLRFGRRQPADSPVDRGIEGARARMVADQLQRRGLRDPKVLEAMAAVPRELFVPNVPASVAYDDRALPIDAGQTISQPYVVARMTELLAVEPGDRILEIGTGSGYQAAILAWLGARVTSIERHADLSDAARERLASLGVEGIEGIEGFQGIDLRVGDGSQGAPDGAPWDGIIVTAAAPAIPDPLREQLAVGARLVIPVGPREQQDLRVVERRSEADWDEWSDGAVVFVPLVGEGGFAEVDPGTGH
jgi:protein-L-isoaspartate(D-aspartate) O-methyltransferase